MIYIKPPRGDILLSELHECVIARFSYFLHKYKQDPSISRDAIKFEYLLMGTALDRTGHFILRLLSAHSDLLKDFVVSSEAAFAVERLEFLSPKQIIQLLKTTLRHVEEVSKFDIKWKTELTYIFKEIKNAFTRRHVMDFKHNENCSEITLKVPFELCLRLVAKRELVLEKGSVLVPCGKWKVFLKCLFEMHMKKEIQKTESNVIMLDALHDPRLLELKDVIIKTLNNSPTHDSSRTNIRSYELDHLRKSFPPCMSYLYSNLKTNHRLSHHARFNLSLFLKDIGMSLNESITFWRTEYSKPCKGRGKCSHSWQADSKKYTYGIRHLYGLEGKRANYHAPTCSKLQANDLGPTEEGGCPFLMFDPENLQTFLDPKVVESEDKFKEILHLKSRDKVLDACNCYRKALMKREDCESENNTVQHFTPVQYFVISNKFNSLDVR